MKVVQILLVGALLLQPCEQGTLDWCKRNAATMQTPAHPEPGTGDVAECVAYNAHWCEACRAIILLDPKSDEAKGCEQWVDGSLFKQPYMNRKN